VTLQTDSQANSRQRDRSNSQPHKFISVLMRRSARNSSGVRSMMSAEVKVPLQQKQDAASKFQAGSYCHGGVARRRVRAAGMKRVICMWTSSALS
jgi:hypothetical protein